jgi:hypothetical protein
MFGTGVQRSFTSEAASLGFSSKSSSIGRAEIVLVNRLVKQLLWVHKRIK